MEMRRPRSLIIVPVDSRGSRVFDTVQRALSEIGVEVVRFEDTGPGVAFVMAILNAVKVSDFIVVDVTRQNANVFYELGYAHALRKPTILVAMLEAGAKIPSVLEGFQYIVYDPADLTSLAGHIKRAASAFVLEEAAMP